MPVIVVANPKGGVGKSTLSSNIAGCFARQGHPVMLGDVDRQQSSRLWLRLRPDNLPRIQTWDIDEDHVARPPRASPTSCSTPPPACTARAWTPS